MKTNTAFDELPRISFRVPHGVLWGFEAAADELGLSAAEYARAACSLATDPSLPRPKLVLRTPDRTCIGVTGTSGRIVGTLQDFLDGKASLDGPESSNSAHFRLPVIVDGAKLLFTLELASLTLGLG